MAMRMITFLLWALTLAVSSAHREHCHQRYGGHSVTAVVVADPGDFAETGEIQYLLDNLKDREQIETERSMCAKAYRGKLLGQHAVLLLSGIGPTSAALCLYDLLSCAEVLREVVYMGTSGWSPQRGGLLNPEDCSAANIGGEVTRIGDVCITPFAVNWVCKKADWVAQCSSYPNLCGRPGEQLGPSQPNLYGKCVFSNPGHGSLELADELLEAAHIAREQGLFPQRNGKVVDWESKYWAAMNENAGVNVSIDGGHTPKAWDYHSCAEVDSQFFYSGVPWELTSRDYTALTLNSALDLNLTARDVIAVSAMEGVGLAEVMTRFNALPGTTRAIPWAIVRGNADWLHNVVAQDSPGVWVYKDRVSDDFNSTYKYSIATSSAVVLSMFQQRCVEQRGRGERGEGVGEEMGEGMVSRRALHGVQKKHKSGCQFEIKYS